MYEVTWMTYEYEWHEQIQTFESEQFKTWDEAADCYNEKKRNINNEHVRIVKILAEYSR